MINLQLKKSLVTIMAVALLATAFSVHAKDVVKIGLAAALSGPASAVGIDIKRGAQIAVAEINANGGVNGHKLKLISRDTEHNPVQLVTQYRELVERQGVVAMIGGSNSGSMLAVTPIVNNNLKVPVIAPASDATAITNNKAKKEGRDNYMFRVGMWGTGQANFIVNTAVEKFGYDDIGLLTWAAGWGQTGRKELERRLKEKGITPVADVTYESGATDMTSQLLKLRNAGADVILNYGLVRGNTFVAQTMEKLDINIPYISAWGIAGPAFWEAAGDAAEGFMTSTTAGLGGPQPSDRVKFIKKYHERYGEDIGTAAFTLGAYDAVKLLKIAMGNYGFKPPQIREGLEHISEYNGLLRNFNRPVFTEDRHHALTVEDMVMARWTNGELLKVKYDGKGRPYVTPGRSTKKYIDPSDMSLVDNPKDIDTSDN